MRLTELQRLLGQIPRSFVRNGTQVGAASLRANFLRRNAFNLSVAAFVTGASISASFAYINWKPVFLDAKNSVGLGSGAEEQVGEVRQDPDTSIDFPTTLRVPSKCLLPVFSLLGLGVRRVSFLGVKVYSVGFYADLESLSLKGKLGRHSTPEEQIDTIVSNASCALRIIPTRSTSYTHLRDGFIRALNARLSAALKANKITVDEARHIQLSIDKFKSLFPNTPLPKHTPLDVLLIAPADQPSKDVGVPQKRSLIMRDLGVIENDWVAKEFVMAYFEGSGISPPMKKDVIKFLEGTR